MMAEVKGHGQCKSPPSEPFNDGRFDDAESDDDDINISQKTAVGNKGIQQMKYALSAKDIENNSR
jgi:hypothetical protein